MKLLIVSGLSGSGKTVAMRTLEDSGFYCIDNLPLSMLNEVVLNMVNTIDQPYEAVAIAIDARSGVDNPEHFERIISPLRELDLNLKILFLTAGTQCLLKRFSETRRKHPLSRKGLPLADAIQQEQKLLTEIQVNADLLIDSSALNVHELRRSINDRFLASSASEMGVLVQSFGFKYGVPVDTDFIFDVRCLPNPHWETGLKPLTGRDKAVAKYLEGYPEVDEMFDAIYSFVTQWLPRFELDSRSYMTISIGCTGGHHRSVYLTEKIAKSLKQEREQVSIRHRDLN